MSSSYRYVINYDLKEFFGVEIEFLFPEKNISEWNSVLDLGILKTDSTTDLEWVSVPMEPSLLIREILARKDAFQNMIHRNNVDTSGMHIHVSKKTLLEGQTSRILYLLNAKSNREYWTKRANRDLLSNEYTRFHNLDRRFYRGVRSGRIVECNSYYEQGFPFYFSGISGYQGSLGCRKRILNITNSKTIEFRLFKSPNTVEGVVENIKIIKDVMDYTREGGYTLPGFLEFRKKQLK